MDDNDAIKIDKLLKELQLNDHDLANELNKQIFVNQKMINRFQNITSFINKQQMQFKEILDDRESFLTNELDKHKETAKYLQYIYLINYNIDTLVNHLDDISESLILAKLNIIPKQILQPDELSVIYSLFSNMSFDIKSDEIIYELLQMQAYYYGNQIIFNLKIPRVTSHILKHVHLIQIPFNEHETLSIQYPFISYNPETIFYFSSKCKLIENQYLCQRPNMSEPFKSSNCIGKILAGSKSKCPTEEMTMRSSIIIPEDNYLLTINATRSVLKNTCGLEQKEIEGTLLLHFENCSITFNGISYNNNWKTSWDQIYLLPVIFNQIEKTSYRKKLSLEKLQDFNFDTLNRVELIASQVDLFNYFHHGISGFIVIGTVIAIFVVYRHANHVKTSELPIPNVQYLSGLIQPAPQIIDPNARINWMGKF